MAIILIIETATKNCSVALTENGQILESIDFNDEKFSHAEKLHLFIESVCHKAGKNIHDIQAVSVSKGPGSYTGLRIGVSSAKGICYALNIPLMSFETLYILSKTYAATHEILKDDILIPMIDARRMEVYTAVMDSNLNKIRPTEALILEDNSFDEYLKFKTCHFFGDGALKSESLYKSKTSKFSPEILPTAKVIAMEAHQSFMKEKFENMAYFEPYYLKDFVDVNKKTKSKLGK
jgi:tRNA threonylcarbamoyladenosine biosynthesis protein TsaB